MQEKLQYKSTISDAITYSTDAETKIGELVTKFSEITTSLINKTWQGESYLKCERIHTLIVEYVTQLEPFPGDLKSNCTSLKDTMDTFDANSTNVVEVGNW